MIDKWIAEATECDFKAALEIKKPKSWLKSVSAFANGIGGSLFFGIDNDRNAIGLSDIQSDAEAISRLIKERITPYPDFVLTPERENGKDILILSIAAGHSTPYYYKADGNMEAYVRIGNESQCAPSYVLNQLVLKGMHRSYDELVTGYDFKDYSFSKLRERYKSWKGTSLEDKFFDSFSMRESNAKLTNAGALLADDSPIRQSRLFCTHWNGLDKSGGIIDAIDSAEYSGSLIILLNEGIGFVKRNMKTRWKKTDDSRIEMPDYIERSVFESLVNALIHRDYLILGSEVHIDIYDDRLTITSPGGMADGSRVQDRNLYSISSTRRNPILADIFGVLGYMERQGSGFRKIREAYHVAHNYREELEPKFYSDESSFQVTLFNLNYGSKLSDEVSLAEKKQDGSRQETGWFQEKQDGSRQETGRFQEKQDGSRQETGHFNEEYISQNHRSEIVDLIKSLDVNNLTKQRILKLYDCFGLSNTFARTDIIKIIGITASPASVLINKMVESKIIRKTKDYGKYIFSIPEETHHNINSDDTMIS